MDFRGDLLSMRSHFQVNLMKFVTLGDRQLNYILSFHTNRNDFPTWHFVNALVIPPD